MDNDNYLEIPKSYIFQNKNNGKYIYGTDYRQSYKSKTQRRVFKQRLTEHISKAKVFVSNFQDNWDIDLEIEHRGISKNNYKLVEVNIVPIK